MAGENTTTHTYFSRAWFTDPQTWTLLIAFAWFVVTDPSITNDLPQSVQFWVARGVLIVALWQRFYSAKRPVALKAGTPVEVHSIEPLTLR